MAATVTDTGRWQEFLKQLLPRELKDAFAVGSRRELLKHVGAAVLVFDDQVIDVKTGRQVRLESQSEHGAESLAAATSDLLEMESGETSVVLLLPPDEFVATSVTMPGMARESLVSALQLQADSLLPSYSEPLLVAVNSQGGDDPGVDVALWIPERRLDALFRAFEQQGLFLAGAIPRCLALADEVGSQSIQEEDRRSITSVTLQDGAVRQWLHVSRKDLEQEIFERQWRHALAAREADSQLELSSENATETYMSVDAHQPGKAEYFFIPGSALQAKRQLEKGKRAVMGAAVLVVVALLASLPFLVQELEIRRLQGNLSNQQQLSGSAREDRQVVQEFEQLWGVITDFPEQELVQTLFTLQSVLSPEQLTSLELSQGVIRIEGESADPQAILQRLEQHPRFTEVAFSRATSNARYYIDLRLSTVNFEGYLVRYFPDN
jgi:hypothetical protein